MRTELLPAEPQPASSPDPSGDWPREQCDRCEGWFEDDDMVTEREWERDGYRWGYQDVRVCASCERKPQPACREDLAGD